MPEAIFDGGTSGRMALGAASLTFDESVPRERAVATVHAAIDSGIGIIDTARAYTRIGEPAHNEDLVAEALASHANGGRVLVATKGGHWRAEDGSFPIDGRAERIRSDVRTSLEHLGRDELDLYYLHWPDPQLPIEQSAEALAQLQEEGLIRRIGLSNVDTGQLARARAVAPIAAVQNPYSALDRGSREVLDACAAAGIAFFAYSPLGGSRRSGSIAEQLPAAARVAARRSVTPQRLMLAWLIRTAPALIPIVGSTRPESITDSAAATALAGELDEQELRRLEEAVSAT